MRFWAVTGSSCLVNEFLNGFFDNFLVGVS